MHRRRLLSLLGAGALGGVAGTGLARSSQNETPDERRPRREEHVEPPRSGLQRVIWSVETEQPLVALTFDDGPDPALTPRILEALDRFDAKATFFVMGHNAAQHPGLLQEVVAAGHEIGGHGWKHVNLAERSVAENRREIEYGTEVVEQRAGVRVRLYRPAYGRFGDMAVRLLARSHRELVLWSVTRGKLAWRDPAPVASHVVDSVRPGDIVDLHDGIGRGTFNQGTELAERLGRRRLVEVEALPEMIEGIRARGLDVATVSEVMAAGQLIEEGA